MGSNQALKEQRGRILVVDDDPLLRELLTIFLEEQGYEVQEAQDGQVGLVAFFQSRFDLIFTDLRMPCMTGLEMAAAVRRVDPVIPIILVTGEAYALEAEALAQVGISRLLRKPYTLDEVRTCLDLMKASWPRRRVA